MENTETQPRYAQVGEQVEVQVPAPGLEMFLNPNMKGSEINPVMNEKHDLYEFDRVEYPPEGGTHLWLKGLKYPIKGFPEPENVAANNKAKRILISQIRLFAKYPLSAYYLMTKSGRNAWFREYIDMVDPILQIAYYVPERYNSVSRELFKIVPIFLRGIGLRSDLSNAMGHIMAAMIEHDDVYRYRIEDLMSLTSKEAMLKNPVKEFEIILKALAVRDQRPHMVVKFGAFAKLLGLSFWLPGFKKAFRNAVQATNFENMQLDEIDKYHTLRYPTYDYQGRSFIDRYTEFLEIHGGVAPKSIPMNQ